MSLLFSTYLTCEGDGDDDDGDDDDDDDDDDNDDNALDKAACS